MWVYHSPLLDPRLAEVWRNRSDLLRPEDLNKTTILFSHFKLIGFKHGYTQPLLNLPYSGNDLGDFRAWAWSRQFFKISSTKWHQHFYVFHWKPLVVWNDISRATMDVTGKSAVTGYAVSKMESSNLHKVSANQMVRISTCHKKILEAPIPSVPRMMEFLCALVLETLVGERVSFRIRHSLHHFWNGHAIQCI